MSAGRGVAIALGAVALALPLAIADAYHIHLLIMAGIFALLTLGLNLVWGYVGLLSLGHPAFFGLGGYTAAMLALGPACGLLVTVPAAAAVGAGVGALIGHVTLRLRGPYFVIVTLAFAEILRLVAINWVDVTNGPMGLAGIPAPLVHRRLGPELSEKGAFYVLVAGLVVLAALALGRLARSRLGRAMIGLREDEALAEAVGISAYRFSMTAFVVGAGLAGVAGAVYAHYIGFVSPEIFGFHFTISMLIMLLVGGLGTVGGPLVGAVLFIAIPEYLRLSKELREPIFGAILIAAVLTVPAGIVPAIISCRRRRSPERAIAAAAAPPPPVSVSASASPAAGPVLEVDRLSIRFGGLDAVREASFRLARGEILSLIGPNGAGKTTILNLATGFLRPTCGRILLGGQAVAPATPPHLIASRGVIRTFQKTRAFAGVSIRTAVMIGLHRRLAARWLAILLDRATVRREEREAAARADALLEFVGLRRSGDELTRTLSYGEQRLLEVAIALAAGPEVLLLDEPAAGMNPEETARVMGLIRRIRDLGVTVLLVEHDMKLVMGLSDRIVVLDHGAVIACGRPAEISADPAVIEAYLGRGFAHARA